MRLEIETIIRYIKGEASSAEVDRVEKWIRASEKHALLYKKIESRIRNGAPEPMEANEIDELWDTLRERLILRERRISITKRMAWWSTAAAVLLFAILLRTVWTGHGGAEQTAGDFPLASELTVTRIVLQDGRVVPVSEDMKAETMMVASRDTALTLPLADGLEFNTLIVAMGDMMKLTLADGTRVVLNGGSTLTYPTLFPANAREVQLTGEGYFDVITDRQRPFVVKTDQVDIRVTGTRFNVCGYSNDEVFSTTLLEGSVIVSNKATGKACTIHPGEEYNYVFADNSERVVLGDSSFSIAWQERRIACRQQSLGQILTRVERMYSVDIRLDDAVDEGILLDCDLPHYENYLSLLQVICDVSDTKLLIKEKDVVIMQR